MTEKPGTPEPPKPFKTADRPNPWTVFSQNTASVITASGALLAFTVPFYKEILGAKPSVFVICILGGIWVSFVLAILLGILSLARLTEYLRQTEGRCSVDGALRKGNRALGCLAVGLLGFGILGGRAILRSITEPKHPLAWATHHLADAVHAPEEQVRVCAAWDEWGGLAWGYRLEWETTAGRRRFDIAVDRKTGELRYFKEVREP